MNISVESLKTLREKTQAGMLDCRRALEEASGDLAEAEKLIMEWGLAQAAKRLDRVTPEGRVELEISASKATLAALSCETDFVSKNEQFIGVTKSIARAFHRAGEEGLQETEVENQALEAVRDLERRMKERILLSGHAALSARPGEILDAYLHGEGRIGAAVRVRVEYADAGSARAGGPLPREAVTGIHDLCLQIAAENPEYISRDAVPGEVLLAMREEFERDVDSDPGLAVKPPKVRAGIIEGKISKRLSRICLMEQRFIKDEAGTVGAFIGEVEKKAGVRITVTGFARLALNS